ncbi:DNA-binding response regulator [Emticicia aquatilis]|uniref:DNA-binding response regulator n=1 Tax=Emticicia aquatilis TaxID=1537369 RepID=A0A916Z8J1_9BACT|nr:LytTR family DNA-binding domain-containing protein [Emticicia aquatilis]GGD81355.1 DNA-binding response regulator [Emticicia aquatilis]
MEKIRCLAVDDEPLALDILANYIQKTPNLSLVATCTEPLEALSLIQQGKVDLLFLDIQMPTLTGIQFLRVMNGKCKTILTTAYSEYAIEGYEYDVADYLLKPISFERFLKAVQKAVGQLTVLIEQPSLGSLQSSIGSENSEVLSTPSTTQQQLDFIFVKTEYKIQKINLSDILYLEGLKDYVSIYTTNERILTLQTMKKMEEMLPSNRFVRVHKSYIVSLEKIETIERQRIFIGKNIIPVGDSFQKDFMKLIG